MAAPLWLALTSTFLTAAPEQPSTAALEARITALERETQFQRQLLEYLLKADAQRSHALLDQLNVAPPVAVTPSSTPTPTPPALPTPPKTNPPAGKAGQFTLSGRVTTTGGTVPHGAWVYVKDVAGRGKGDAEIKQQNKAFLPGTLAVQVGTKVSFPNFDAVFHDVFSRSPGNTFDLGPTQAGDPVRSVVVTKPGVLEVFCNFHSKMMATVLVVPGPLFAPVDAQGRFTLANVPRGKHTVVAWVPGGKQETQTLTVTGDETELSFEVTVDAPRAHLNKSGLPYGSYGD